MYQYRHFTPQNIAPKGARCIVALDKAGGEVARIPLGPLTPPAAAPLYSFGLVSDLHIYPIAAVAWKPEAKFRAALAFFEKAGCAFCIHCGDFTQTGLFIEGNLTTVDTRQFEMFRTICQEHPDLPVYGCCGNHESILGVPIANYPDELRLYTGNDLYFSMEHGGDLFIFLGQPTYNQVMGDDALAWLQTTLADNADKRCFVFIHPFIEEDSGDPLDLRENSVFDDWGTVKTAVFLNALRRHPNVVLIHGHSHMKFECQEYDVSANYTERNGFKSVHVPSLARPRVVNPDTGATPEDDSGSQGYIVDVYDDCIVLNGWDFVGDKPVPLGTYKIAT